MAVAQSQQGPSDLIPSPNSSQVNAEASPKEEEIRYFCICGKDYAQPQGVWLHIRTAHNPNPKQCFLCEFTYARPYDYRNHLKKKHRGVDPDVILGKPAGSRRRATTLTEQQPSVSPPAVEQDQQDWAESQPNPSAPPSPAGAGVTSVSPPPAVSSVDYNSQPIYADSEQAVPMDEDEYTPGSEVFDATYDLAMPPSTEERVELNDVDAILQDGQLEVPSAPGGSIASHSIPNAEMAHPHSPAVGETCGALVSEDPIVGSFEPMPYSPLSDAEIDATFDSIFNCTL